MSIGIDEVDALLTEINTLTADTKVQVQGYDTQVNQLETDWQLMTSGLNQCKLGITDTDTSYTTHRPLRGTSIGLVRTTSDGSLGYFTGFEEGTDLNLVYSKINNIGEMQKNVEASIVKVKTSLR